MVVVNQLVVEVLNVLQRDLEVRNLGGTQTTDTPQPTTSASTSAAPAATTSMPSSGSGGPTSSPLLFFVALGFGVVFTNLWIIVGVKYCFRYNARNRALRNGEDVDAVNLDQMPARPHRRRKEKKLMTMDEVNDRFPLTKYKNWVAARAREGLSTSGGVAAVAASSSRAASLREVEGVIPSSPVDTKHSVNNTRPTTAVSEAQPDAAMNPTDRKSMEATAAEKDIAPTTVEEQPNHLEQVRTTASTVDKQATRASEADDEDDDDHIHTAVPPELLTNPGDSCAICIDTLEDDDDIRGLTCGHAFHAGCLDPWLTSRRACCPLCKADYYTPKPRPEGEVAEPDRTGRSRRNREAANAPQPPPSAWTDIRGHARLGPLSRFAGTPYVSNIQQDRSRSARRAARQGQATANTQPTTGSTVVPDVNAPSPAVATPSRNWNPFSSLSMPAMRFPTRNRQQETSATPATGATPSQLEAGVCIDCGRHLNPGPPPPNSHASLYKAPLSHHTSNVHDHL